MSDERVNSIAASNYSITPSLDHLGAKIRVKFNGNYLKQDKIICTHRKTVNTHIAYEINKNYNIISYPTLDGTTLNALIELVLLKIIRNFV